MVNQHKMRPDARGVINGQEPGWSEPLSVRTLLAVAERRTGMDPKRCRLVFAHLETAALLQTSLEDALRPHRLSDLQFATLVVLFAVEPEPLSTTVLAAHTGASTSAITSAIDKLAALGFAMRTRDERDRRMVYNAITEAGLTTVDRAINDYLQAATSAARYVRSSEHLSLLNTYLHLLKGVAPKGGSNRRPSISPA